MPAHADCLNRGKALPGACRILIGVLALSVVMNPLHARQDHTITLDHFCGNPAPQIDHDILYLSGNDNYLYAVAPLTGKVLWRFQTASFGPSIVGIQQGMIYLGSRNEYGEPSAKYILIALDQYTGKLIWTASFEKGGYANNMYPNAELILVNTENGNKLIAVDLKTGIERWRYQAQAPVIGSLSDDRSAFVRASDFVIMFDLQSGREVRRVDVKGQDEMSLDEMHRLLLVYDYNGNTSAYNASNLKLQWRKKLNDGEYPYHFQKGGVYSASFEGVVRGVEPQTGIQQWEYRAPSHSDCRPVFSDRFAFVEYYLDDSEDADHLRGYAAVSLQTGKAMWRGKNEGGMYIAAAVVNGNAYVGSGKVIVSVNIQSGHEVWRRVLEDNIRDAPVFYKSLIVVTTRSGRVYAMDAANGAKRWELLSTGWHRRLRAMSTYGIKYKPVVSGGSVMIADHVGQILAFEEKSGKPLWHVETGQSVDSEPRVTDTGLLVEIHDGRLLSLSPGDGKLQWQAVTGFDDISRLDYGQGQIFARNADNNIKAISSKTGELLWDRKGKNYGFSEPASNEGILYLFTPMMMGIEAATGKELWLSQFGSVNWPDTEVILREGTLFSCITKVEADPSESILVIDGKTGEIKKTIDTVKQVHISPPPLDISGYMLVFPDREDNYHGINWQSGEQKWIYHARFAVGTRTYTNEDAVHLCGIEKPEMIALDLLSGKERWKAPHTGACERIAVAAGLLVSNDNDGVLRGVDRKTGKVMWESPDYFLTTTPVVSGGTLFVTAEDGRLIALDAKSGGFIWQIETEGFQRYQNLIGRKK